MEIDRTHPIVKQVEKFAKNGVNGKIICNNAYERKIAHIIAEELGISHRSIIDYTHPRKDVTTHFENKKKKFKVVYSPQSFVEVNGRKDLTHKFIIGNESMLPGSKEFDHYPKHFEI